MTTNARIIKNSNGGAIEITGTLTNNGSPVGGGIPVVQNLTPTGLTQTIDWSLGTVVYLNLSSATGNITPTFLNPTSGMTYQIVTTQGIKVKHIIWPSNFLFDENGWLLSPTSDVISLTYDGTNYICSIVKKNVNTIIPGYQAMGWGSGTSGQLGDGTAVTKSSPVSVAGLQTRYVQIVSASASTAARKADGSVWCWGINSWGQLGNGDYGAGTTSYNKSSPGSVLGGHSFTSLAGGDVNCLALKADGSVWGWGYNNYGQLGTGVTNSAVSPVSVVGGHSFVNIAAGDSFGMALKADGSVWAWGYGTSGQLGDNTIVSKSSPVSVVGGHSFTAISAGGAFSLALKSNGSVWAWGTGTNGQLGDGTTVGKSSPVAVTGGHSFVNIWAGSAYALARKADGSVWAWGTGTSGQLGDNTTADKSSPVSVVGGHSFVAICAGLAYSFGLKANGNLWAWGANTPGTLGDGTTVGKSSPISVIGGYSFYQVCIQGGAGGDTVNALLTDYGIVPAYV